MKKFYTWKRPEGDYSLTLSASKDDAKRAFVNFKFSELIKRLDDVEVELIWAKYEKEGWSIVCLHVREENEAMNIIVPKDPAVEIAEILEGCNQIERLLYLPLDKHWVINYFRDLDEVGDSTTVPSENLIEYLKNG